MRIENECLQAEFAEDYLLTEPYWSVLKIMMLSCIHCLKYIDI